MAGALALVLMVVFWGFFGRTTDAQARMLDVMQTMDAATLQTRLDEDVRTAIEVVEPATLSAGQRLTFYDREYRKVTYELRPSSGSQTLDLVRSTAADPKPRIVATSIHRGMFHRMGPRLVGYLLDFEPRQRPGAAPGTAPVAISLTSKVFLSNGVY